ncbi:hypothetical protein CN204_04145 [Sinorhizobium meliloti]|uniref:hypothetical protein n=1 Tax=Rhizobium meliloti TaxID=382 RepID=UPI000FD98AF7|nr:hypothetical protein [Sinorhizobium meliloti]RVH87730.1 hypothetical protein CN204_04145 [Sinorhizobium meliloti]
MPVFLLSLFTRAKGYASVIIGGALFLAFAYYRAKQDGKNAAMLEEAKRRDEAIKQRKSTDEEVDRLSLDRRRDELGRWMRKDD